MTPEKLALGCILHEAGEGRLIFTIPKSLFGDKVWRMRDVIRKELFPKIHTGSYPAWESTHDTIYQVELYDRQKAEELVSLIAQWIKENV